MKALIALLFLCFAGCAQYGEDSNTDVDVVVDPTPAPPMVCEDIEPCPECEICEECETCPELPKGDPCDCFEICDNSYDTQVCLTDFAVERGFCPAPGKGHMDFRLWCKIDGQWHSEKTWVYPCEEERWYNR